MTDAKNLKGQSLQSLQNESNCFQTKIVFLKSINYPASIFCGDLVNFFNFLKRNF